MANYTRDSQSLRKVYLQSSFNLFMDLTVDDQTKNEIGKVISSKDSPVGIDAKKTHIIIINKLVEIEKRLAKLEQKRR